LCEDSKLEALREFDERK